MEVTLLGWFLIPVGLMCWLAGTAYLLPLAVFSSVFQAASVLNLTFPTSYSLSPYYFICSLMAVRMLVSGGREYRQAPWLFESKVFFRYLLYFLLWVMMSSLMLPYLFEGVGVYIPRLSADEQYLNLQPLAWSLGNLTQIIYLCLNVNMLFSAWYFGKQKINNKRVNLSFNIAGLMVIFFGLLQKICYEYEIKFPNEFLYSNHQLTDAERIGVTRISSTFSEPSLFSSFILSYTLYVFYAHKSGFGKILILVAATLTFIWSEAGTGYLAVGLIMAIVMWSKFVLPLIKCGSLSKNIIYVSLLILAITFLFAFNGGLEKVNEVVFQKTETLSSLYRFASDLRAIELFFESGGLGVGLGSNRSSSFLTCLLSTVGVIGLCFFVGMIRLHPVFHYNKRVLFNPNVPVEISAAMWSVFSVIICMVIAIPDLANNMLWVSNVILLMSVRADLGYK